MRHKYSNLGHGTSGSRQGSLDNSISANKNSGKSKLECKLKINKQKQNKHIRGTKEFQEGKSELTISLEESQNLVDKFHNNGQKIGDTKERVDFGKTIGYFVDEKTGKKVPTSNGIIHYSNTGSHIVPSRPKGGKKK